MMWRMMLLLWCIGITLAKAQYGLRLQDAQSKLPVVNVTVRVLGNGRPLQGNEQGEVMLTGLTGEQRLRISAMGYLSDTLTLQLPLKQWFLYGLKPTSTQLQEVIVNTGYQQLPKERATGSFSVVDNKTFNEQQGVAVLSRLEGITPALSVDRRTYGGSIMIRGLSTINGDRAPLIVVDDFPYAGDLDNLNPNDVESVTVLKDAAAGNGMQVRYNSQIC